MEATMQRQPTERETTMRVKFYDGRKLVAVILTSSPTRVINEWIMNPNSPAWTRYKIAA